ncbi:protein deglycase HchA [Acetobacteraceae bacterium]|nr:protein deglycase HchA [Acetobacteraceae bacterium]
MTNLSKAPIADKAERDAYFPSEFSLSQFTAPTTGAKTPVYDRKYTGSKKILVIATQERYLPLKEGKFFSSGNHPVETLLPMAHLHAAGFEFDIATPSGEHVKFEEWAFPSQDKLILEIFQKYQPAFTNPLDLRRVVQNGGLGKDSDYLAVFIPGGHGVLNTIPLSHNVGQILKQAIEGQKFIITLCHGPACLLSLSVLGRKSENPEERLNFADPAKLSNLRENPLAGFEICAFPDQIDKEMLQSIGYIPAPMQWFIGEALEKQGLKILPSPELGRVHRDRILLTGDSPVAADALGKLAAETFLEAFA